MVHSRLAEILRTYISAITDPRCRGVTIAPSFNVETAKMTLTELVKVYSETHPNNNLLCDGEHCTDSNSKVRIIPLDDSCNVHLCESCYNHELGYNQDRELDGLERILPDLPFIIYPRLFPQE